MAGEQVVTNPLTVDRQHPLTFFRYTGAEAADHCSSSPADCVDELAVAGEADFDDDGAGSRVLSLALPHVGAGADAAAYGFAVDMTNELSSVKFDPATGEVNVEGVTLLDPVPASSGEWVRVEVAQWDARFVSNQSRSC